MARSGAPTADAHAIDQIVERQKGECARAGCNEPISTTEKVRMGDEEGFLKIINCGELQHIRPRALGGTDDISNLEIMCDQCHGMTARTISIPVYLMQQSKRWLDDQDEVRSFTQLVRLSVADYIKTDESHVERRIHERTLRDMEKLKQKLEGSLAHKKEAVDATVKLTRLYGYEVKAKSLPDIDIKKKSKQRDHLSIGRDDGGYV